MTNEQREALYTMDRRGVGAVYVSRGYVYRCDVREDNEAAVALLAHYRMQTYRMMREQLQSQNS